MEILNFESEFDGKKTYEIYSSPSHSVYSNISMSILDNSYKKMLINLSFISQYYMFYTKDQILANLLRCQSSKVKFRSYKKNDKFLDMYKNIFLSIETHEPINNNEYQNGYKAILDIEELNDKIIFKIWKWLQPVRIINFELKDAIFV